MDSSCSFLVALLFPMVFALRQLTYDFEDKSFDLNSEFQGLSIYIRFPTPLQYGSMTLRLIVQRSQGAVITMDQMDIGSLEADQECDVAKSNVVMGTKTICGSWKIFSKNDINIAVNSSQQNVFSVPPKSSTNSILILISIKNDQKTAPRLRFTFVPYMEVPSQQTGCASNLFLCQYQQEKRCISRELVCNSHLDCGFPNSTDEDDCGLSVGSVVGLVVGLLILVVVVALIVFFILKKRRSKNHFIREPMKKVETVELPTVSYQ